MAVSVKLRAGEAAIRKLRNTVIGVLMGGVSSEREISLKSGGSVMDAFKGSDFRMKAIDIITDDFRVIKQRIKRSGIELAFIALHGRFGEDGQIQLLLDEMGIRYTGSGPQASRLAFNKVESSRMFLEAGLRTPRCKIFYKESGIAGAEYRMLSSDFGLPLVIKPCREGSSIGLSLADTERDFIKAVRLAFKYDDEILVEKYIRGRELTVGILGDCALPIVEIKPRRAFFDYKAKYTKGFTDYICPAQLDSREAVACKSSALAAHNILGCECFSRVDMILKDNTPHVLEVNTIPGLTPLSLLPKSAKCLGLNFTDLCLELLRLAYEKKK